MPTPLFPRSETLLDGKPCPLAQFDALYGTLTQVPGGRDGYFIHAHPGEPRLLFVVDGYPYGTGRFSETGRTFEEIRDFFTAYSRWPDSPLSFVAADRRLLVALMICFQHRPARVVLEPADLNDLLQGLEERGATAVLSLQAGEEWGLTACARGVPVLNFFPPSRPDMPGLGLTAREQLEAYVAARSPVVELYEQTRVTPAPDIALITRESQGQLSLAFLKGAAALGDAPAAMDLAAAALLPEPDVAGIGAAAAATEAPGDSVASAAASVESTSAPQGAAGELQLFIGDKQIGAYTLAGGEATIGRTPGNTIVIENAGVSRRHAVARYEGDRVVLEDLASANGTFVNGQRVTRYELKDGDEITIVKHRLVFRASGAADAVTASPAVPMTDVQNTVSIDTTSLPPQAPRVEGHAALLRPRLILPDLKKLPLDDQREVTLGTGSDCIVALTGMFVGKLHAKVVPQPDGQFKLVHVSGLAGTRVNGEKIAEHVLRNGDEIEIGKQRILFRLER